MNETTTIGSLHQAVLYLPAVTTVLSAFFCHQLFSRYRAKGGGLHLLWWGIGMLTYGIGTFTEAYTSIFGWTPGVFRTWYIAGAFLGGYPLAQGSIYLLMSRRFAHRSAIVVTSLIGLASIFVVLTPLDASAVETHRLSGQVIEWSWVRLISPFFNIYSVIFLAGGAVVSALRFRRAGRMRHRYVGNSLIAIGAILPGIGGSMTRAGFVEVLYVTELVGLCLIYGGYRLNIRETSGGTVREKPPLPTAAALLMAVLLVPGLSLGQDKDGKPESSEAAEAEEAAAPAGAQAGESAQEGEAAEEESDEDLPKFFGTTNVTATSREQETFEVAPPVIVLDEIDIIEQVPNSATDLLRNQAGVDVNGVGPNAARPIIRGARGLRVLYLENGLRMNNARRQTSFGEITGLTDVVNVASVEVQRGPASVLYGTDAIGGVINLVTRTPRADGVQFGLGLRYSDADSQAKGNASIAGRSDSFGYLVSATVRTAEDYDSGTGTFGDISLPDGATVIDTGLDDDAFNLYLEYRLNENSSLTSRVNRYRADQTGFGFVDPALLEDDSGFTIRILYPFQDFDRYTLGYEASGLTSGIANTVKIDAYYQDNERELVNDIFIDIGPIFGGFFGEPNSSVEIDTLNFTDLETTGIRAELGKAAGTKHYFSYGADYFEDVSFNTDDSVTTTRLFAPFPFGPSCNFLPSFFFECPFVDEDNVANTPNATNESIGVFVQDQIYASDNVSLTAGLRWGKVSTNAEPTPGLDVTGFDFDDDQVVGALGVVWGVSPNWNIVGSFGTAFRAPGIVERLFNGITPEGAGFQILNPDLVSENSQNVDVGLKYLGQRAFLNATYFNNEIDDAIIQNTLTDEEIAQLPQDVQDEIDQAGVSFVVQQANADKLTIDGFEIDGGYRWDSGVSVGGNYTHLSGKSENRGAAADPTGSTVSDKYNGWVRYDGNRFWVNYHVRRNDEEDVILDPNEVPGPLGEVLPSFTIQTLSGGVTVYSGAKFGHQINLVIDNLTDELYAEFSNAVFFRPNPGRNVILSYSLRAK